MRAGVVMLLLVCLCVPTAQAVPVDPNAPDQIAAWFWNLQSGSPFINLLRTNGEVWTWRPSLGWYRAGASEGYPYDPPVAVADIVDWTPQVFQTRDRAAWVLNDLATWQEVPFPPFAPITASKQSLGGIKKLFR